MRHLQVCLDRFKRSIELVEAHFRSSCGGVFITEPNSTARRASRASAAMAQSFNANPARSNCSLGLLLCFLRSLRRLCRLDPGVVPSARPDDQLAMTRRTCLDTYSPVSSQVRRFGRMVADGVLVPDIASDVGRNLIHFLQ